ncbi:TPA: type II toxin-antitoxin system VapC family toxin [Candidatus Woesearchaeota archaeon]|nr:type II toxin-antitoxin system VapC family toxin [Candidatus Woesearchaeota archaeon]
MNKEIYFFDTYAIIEILKGSPNYIKYKEVKAVVSIFNLVELHLYITRIFDEQVADTILDEYSKYAVSFSIEDIKETTRLKIKYAKRKFSIPDAVGYVIAKRLNIKFLTGDQSFSDLDNVEFIKSS